MTTQYTIPDRRRTLTFTGVRLAHSATRPRDGRWHEVEIFRTDDGQYVVHKMGGSTNEGEVHRHSAQVSNSPEGVVECMHSTDPDGVIYLTRTARDTLEAACAQDVALDAAYRNQSLTSTT